MFKIGQMTFQNKNEHTVVTAAARLHWHTSLSTVPTVHTWNFSKVITSMVTKEQY